MRVTMPAVCLSTLAQFAQAGTLAPDYQVEHLRAVNFALTIERNCDEVVADKPLEQPWTATVMSHLSAEGLYSEDMVSELYVPELSLDAGNSYSKARGLDENTDWCDAEQFNILNNTDVGRFFGVRDTRAGS